MPSETSFHLFTSLRYDPLLLTSTSNSLPTLNFITPSPFYMLVYHRDRMLEAAQHFDFHSVAQKLSDGIWLHEILAEKVAAWLQGGEKDGPLKLRLLFDKDGKLEVEFMSLPAVPLSTLYPSSLDPPVRAPTRHPADTSPPPPKKFTPHPLTGGTLNLCPTESLAPSQNPNSAPPPEWKLKLDTSPTPSTPFTLLKTTHRAFYDASRSRALPSNPGNPLFSEVMLFNEVGELTEGSMTSLYFFRGGRWVTPPVGVPTGAFSSSTLKDGIEDGTREEEERRDEGELRKPFLGRWGHSVRSAKVGAGGQRGTTRRWALGMGMCMEETVSTDTVQEEEGVWVSNGVRGFGFGRVVS